MSDTPVVYDLAAQYRDEIKAALEKDGVHADAKKFKVTNDPLLIPKLVDTGVICVNPPELTFDTFNQFDAEWALTIVVGPMQLLDVAFQRLARVIEVIRTTTTLPIERAYPDSYRPQDGQGAYAAYVITFTHSYETTLEETP